MIKVGVIGLGMMGLTHLDVYGRCPGARVTAVADLDAGRRTGKSRAVGNIDGQVSGGFDYDSAQQFEEGMDLIADADVDVVDICLTTPLHSRFALAAMRAGKHVLIEKPLTRTAGEAAELVRAAERAKGVTMCAMCMRFWPAWQWLKEAIDRQTYGTVRAAQFRRVASHPGGAFYSDGQANGGAVLDLHIHDTDFIQYCFGVPESVSTVGYTAITGQLDHVVTQYRYPHAPLVTAEGGWAMAAGFGFRMQFNVNFERATASFDLGASQELTLFEPGKPARGIEVAAGLGYEHEIAYFLDCVKAGRRPQRVTLRDAARSVAIVEAEVRSARSGLPEAPRCLEDAGVTV